MFCVASHLWSLAVTEGYNYPSCINSHCCNCGGVVSFGAVQKCSVSKEKVFLPGGRVGGMHGFKSASWYLGPYWFLLVYIADRDWWKMHITSYCWFPGHTRFFLGGRHSLFQTMITTCQTMITKAAFKDPSLCFPSPHPGDICFLPPLCFSKDIFSIMLFLGIVRSLLFSEWWFGKFRCHNRDEYKLWITTADLIWNPDLLPPPNIQSG